MRPCTTSYRRVLTATGTALTAALLPLALATPALATTAPGTTSAPVTSEPAPQQTAVRISGPATAAPGSSIRVYARLLADGAYVVNGTVDLQRFNGSSWVNVGRITTGSQGLGSTAYTLPATSKLRARHVATPTRTAAVSSTLTVTAQTLGQRAVAEAKRHYGKHYQYGATGPTRFDCSGFTGYVFRQLGKSLPRTSGQQQAALRRIPNASKQVGDLIFTWRSGRVTHVGIYAGNNTMWAATKTGDIVRTQSLYSRYYTVGRV